MAQSLTNKNRLLEKYTQVVREDGLNTNKNVNIGINGATPNLWVAGNLSVGGTATGSFTPAVPLNLSGANANALSVGANGTTNPQFNIDTSASSVATGLNIAGAAAGSGVALTAISSGTNEGLSIIPKGTGVLTLGASASGNVAVNHQLVVTSNGTNSLVVGANGGSNGAFQVDSSISSAATGLNVRAAAAGGGVALNAISSGTNESLTLAAKGTGVVTINPASVLTSGGLAGSSVLVGASSIGVYVGTGAPTISAAQGSIYLNNAGSSIANRLYVNSSGSTTWVAVTTAS